MVFRRVELGLGHLGPVLILFMANFKIFEKVWDFRIFVMISNFYRLWHGLLEGGMVGEFLGHVGPVPFFLSGEPQDMKIKCS